MTTPKRLPPPPDHLSDTSALLWASVVADYLLEDWHLRLLTEALHSLDRAEQARGQLDLEGLTIRTRLDEIKAHPLLIVERDARASFARLIKQLGLDLEGPPSPSTRRR